LFGHTFKPYPTRLFVLFCEKNFGEMLLKVVPFVSGSDQNWTVIFRSKLE
jgi:hypothetical protein